jgi:hypothetical protein
MKKLILLSFLLLCNMFFAQEKLISKTGKITLEASVPAFEEIKAINSGVTVVLNTKTGELASLALLKGFRFKIALMEEHFNENYVESDKYPKATFRGKISDFNVNSLSSNPKEFKIKGTMEIHGMTKELAITANIKKNTTGISIDSDFSILASDYNIEIPSIVKSKVSNKVKLNLDATLK